MRSKNLEKINFSKKLIFSVFTFVLLTFFVLGMHYALAKEGSNDVDEDDEFASTQSIEISPSSISISETSASKSVSSGSTGSGRSTTPGSGSGGTVPPPTSISICGNNICEEGEAGYCLCPPEAKGCMAPCVIGTCPKDCESKDKIKVKVPSTFSLSVGQKAEIDDYFEMKLLELSTKKQNFCCGSFDESSGTSRYFWSDDKYCGYEGMSCAGSCPSVVDESYCSPKKACTEEAKICPDGSAVGRTGPNCEFAPCPGNATSKKCAKYSRPDGNVTVCATCGDGICEPYETCTSSDCGKGTCTDDCGPLYCREDCENTRAITGVPTTSPTIITKTEPIPVTIPTSQQFAVIEINTHGGCGPNPPPGCLGGPARLFQTTLFQGESKEISGTLITLASISGYTATFKISFTNEFGCDVEFCKKYICCTGTTCPAGMPRQCGSCTQDICSPTCGNGICEEGEADYCPPCPSGQPCPAMPCYSGTCPKDCQAAKCSSDKDCPTGVCTASYPSTCYSYKCENGVCVRHSDLQSAPICAKIGTENEGWYVDGKLIKYDKCTCTAVCKSTEKGQGYFSSCNNEFIQYAECLPSTITVSVGVKKVEIKQDASAGVVVIKSEASAETKEKIIVEGKKLKVSTKEGAKEIVLPEEAKQQAISSGLKQVSKIELKSENGKSYYEVEGKTTTYFLWFIPITSKTEIKVDAETKEVIGK